MELYGPNKPGSLGMAIADAIRAYPVALARMMAQCKPGDARLDRLNARYRTLTPEGQLMCRAELLEIAEAKRGNRPAEVLN